MSATVAAIGADVLVRCYALAGVLVVPADGPDAVRDAWRTLPRQVGLVVLTRDAAAALGDELNGTWPMVAVMT